MKKATVFGAGSFGTAVSQMLATNFEEVALFGIDRTDLDAINQRHENPAYLPGLQLSERIRGVADLHEAAAGTQLCVVAVPSQVTRKFMTGAAGVFPAGVPIVTVAKGIETGTLCTMTEVLEQTLPPSHASQVAVLSGPSFAKDMMARLPTVVTVASKSADTCREVQRLMSSEVFRTYTSTDVVGVQVGGALKNVIAIAAGISDGMGLGHNSRAAIITRGLAEITRIAVKMGGNPLTLSGLAGMGDLVLTCTGELSRNRTVGMELGKGRPLPEILGALNQVAEGIQTARSARDLSRRMEVELPICEQVYLIAFEGKGPRAALTDLMLRTPKSELPAS